MTVTSLLEEHPSYLNLHPYQREGALWLTNRKQALLADEMGLGKSFQAIVASDLIEAENIVVICPAVARGNWKKEFEKWAAPRAYPNFMVFSYDEFVRKPALSKISVDLLILDEAHYLKNRQTKRTKLILGRYGLVHKAKWTWALTGTPMPNGLDEIWPLLLTFGGTALKYAEFVERYCTGYDSGYGFKVTGTKEAMLPEIHKMLDQVMLRRRKVEVLKDLPPIYSTITYIPESPIELDISHDFREYVVSKQTNVLHERYNVETELMQRAYKCLDAPTGDTAQKLLSTLATTLSTLRRVNGMKKIGAAAELISDELTNNAYEKVVIFCYHRDVIAGLSRRLKDFGVVVVDGSTVDRVRNSFIDSFQKEPETRVFIGQIIACGTAINLSAANQVIVLEPDWVPANNAQALARCHRIGQTKTVFVRFFAIENSVDAHIIGTLERKTRDANRVLRDPKLPGEMAALGDPPHPKHQAHGARKMDELKKIVDEARALHASLPKQPRDEDIYGESFPEPPFPGGTTNGTTT